MQQQLFARQLIVWLPVFGALAQDEPADALISPAYRRYAEREIVAGFKKSVHREPSADELAEALSMFEERVSSLPNDIARELGQREQRNLEARADFTDRGPLALLANLAGGGAGPLEDLVASDAACEALFPRTATAAKVVVSKPGEIAAALAPGVRIELPAGVFELGNLLAAVDEFPREVTLAGAGIDATLIVLTEPLGARGALEDFALAGCTLLTRSNQLFDQAHPATLSLDGVRVCGFDNGANRGGTLVFKRGLALRARNCAFEGGYGSVPGSGSLFALPNAALIARFDNCSFALQSAGIGRLIRGVTLRYERCRFERIVDDPAREAEHLRGVRLVECSLERLEPGAQRPPRRTLDALFPAWESRFVR